VSRASGSLPDRIRRCERDTAAWCINDVGENTWEEINDGVAGANYGWPNCEGACSPTNPNLRNPIFQYSHTERCAIVGGAFYNPAVTQFPPGYTGVYFFADLCGGFIRTLDPANGNQVSTFATGLANPVDVAVSADGSLYYLQRGPGSVSRAEFTSAPNVVTLTFVTQPSGLQLTFDGQPASPWPQTPAAPAGWTPQYSHRLPITELTARSLGCQRSAPGRETSQARVGDVRHAS
jgi:hypothetical protein